MNFNPDDEHFENLIIFIFVFIHIFVVLAIFFGNFVRLLNWYCRIISSVGIFSFAWGHFPSRGGHSPIRGEYKRNALNYASTYVPGRISPVSACHL